MNNLYMNNLKQENKIKNRMTWNEYFMEVAEFISKRSSCNRLSVGSVIVKNNRILATGYNGHIKGAEHTSLIEDGHEQMTIHSEINSICDCSGRGVSTKDATIYITHFPCINCTKAIIAAEINTIIYINDYKNNKICYDLMKLGKIKLIKLIKFQ